MNYQKIQDNKTTPSGTCPPRPPGQVHGMSAPPDGVPFLGVNVMSGPNGYIKLYRQLKEKAFYKDSKKVHFWIHLLFKAAWNDEREEYFNKKPIKLKPGQFTCGRLQLSIETGINESSIERLLTYFEKVEQQIEQQKCSTNRLITILNWEKYQVDAQRSNNDRTTVEQRSNTLKEYKEKEEKEEHIGNLNSCPYKAIIDLYHTICCDCEDGLPRVRTVVINGAPQPYFKGELAKNLTARWNENDTQKSLDWWTKFFTLVAESDFLMGKVPGRDGRKTFRASLAWLVRPCNFAKVVDFKYSDAGVA